MVFLKKYDKISIFFLLVILFLSTATGLSVVYLQTKFIAALIILPAFFLFWINSTPVSKIALTILVITFPILIQFMGKDAMSTGTLLIFLLYIWNREILIKNRISIKHSNVIFKIVSILILISIAGVFSKTPPGYYGPAIRHLINFISSVFLFVVVIKTTDLPGVGKNNKEYIEMILSILILIVSLHILLSLLFYLFPDTQYLFKVFFHRTQTHLGSFKNSVFSRAASIFTGGEELGELLAVLFPFFLYKAFTNKKFIFLLPVFFIGLFISGTRSATLLVVIELIVFFFMTRSKEFGRKKIVISLGALFLLLIGSSFIFSSLDILMSRFQETTLNIQTDAKFTTVLNREYVWKGAWNTTWRTLSAIGHGPIQAVGLGMNKGYPSFHCLYLTLIFQYGVIGFSIFSIFFFYLIKRLIARLQDLRKNDPYYPLILACVLSLLTFLINEVKFEFNRGDSYQQIIWIVFGIFFLAGKKCQTYSQ